MQFLKIDDVAKQTGLTKRTIRYYEEIGLLPEPQRSEGGTRLYTQADIDLLNKLMTAKEVLGFSLQELQKYVAMNDLLENKKVVYRSASNEHDQKERLVQLVNVLEEQLDLIEVKFLKIQKIKLELEDLRTRAVKKIKELEEK